MSHKAHAAHLAGDAQTVIATYRELALERAGHESAALEAGLLSERTAAPDVAHEFYQSIAASERSVRTDDLRQLAARAIERLDTPDTSFARSATDLADRLTTAVEAADGRTLGGLADHPLRDRPDGRPYRVRDLDMLEIFLSQLSSGTYVCVVRSSAPGASATSR